MHCTVYFRGGSNKKYPNKSGSDRKLMLGPFAGWVGQYIDKGVARNLRQVIKIVREFLAMPLRGQTTPIFGIYSNVESLLESRTVHKAVLSRSYDITLAGCIASPARAGDAIHPALRKREGSGFETRVDTTLLLSTMSYNTITI